MTRPHAVLTPHARYCGHQAKTRRRHPHVRPRPSLLRTHSDARPHGPSHSRVASHHPRHRAAARLRPLRLEALLQRRLALAQERSLHDDLLPASEARARHRCDGASRPSRRRARPGPQDSRGGGLETRTLRRHRNGRLCRRSLVAQEHDGRRVPLVGRALRRRPSDDGSRLRPHGRSRPLLALGTRGHGLRLHCLLLCAQGRPPACCSRRTSLRRRLRAPVRRGPRHGRRALRLARARHGHRRLAHLRGAPRAHPRGPQLARLRKAALRKGPRPPDSLLVDVRPQHAVSCTRRRPLRAELRLEHARGPDARGPLLRPSLHLHSAPHARHGAASSRAPRRSRAPEPDRRDLLRGHARLRHCVRPEHGPQRHLHRRTRGLGLFLRTHAPARSGRRPSARPRCLRGRHDARRPQAGRRAWRRRHPCTRRRCRRAIHADEHACGRHAKRQGAALPHHARQRPLQPRHHARKGRLARCGPKAHRRSEARVLRQAQPSRRPSRRHRRDHPLGELGARRLRPRHHARASRRRRDQPSVRHGLRLEHRRFASLHAEQDRPLRLRPQPHHRRGGSAVAPRPCGRARRLGRQPERLQGHVCGHRGAKRRLRLGPVL